MKIILSWLFSQNPPHHGTDNYFRRVDHVFMDSRTFAPHSSIYSGSVANPLAPMASDVEYVAAIDIRQPIH